MVGAKTNSLGSALRVIPVLDVQNGVAVRGLAGRRHEYRPLVSRLSASPDPLAVADAFQRLGYAELYLADLDAIGGAVPDWQLVSELHRRRWRLWLDAGVRIAADVGVAAAAGVENVVIGLETVRGPDEIRAAVEIWGRRVVVSLDLKDGRPLGDLAAWGATDAEAIADRVLELGASRLIALDLARVGTSMGVGTEDLCRRIACKHRGVELVAGGGIRNRDDLLRLETCGVSAALVGSMLHDERR